MVYLLSLGLSSLFLTLFWVTFWPVQKKKFSTVDKEGVKSKFVIGGMFCTGCALNVETAIGKLQGTEKINVNFSSSLADVIYDPNKLSIGEIIKAVESAGYTARPTIDQISALKQARESKEQDVLFVKKALLVGLPFSIIVIIGSMMMMFVHLQNWVNWVLVFASIPVIFWTGKHFFTGAFKIALKRQTNMDTLVSLGVAASFIFSILSIVYPALGRGALYLDGAVVIVMLVLLGNFLRSRAELLAMREIFDVASLLPEIAHKEENEEIVDVQISELKEGDLIVIRATERAPADCIIVEGSSEFNNSHITGESMPVSVNPGDKIFAGTINGYGLVKARCEKVGQMTVLSRVIELIVAAIQTKPKVQELVDKVASIFVPTSVTIAIVAFNIFFLQGLTSIAINAAISVVVISCPCALGLATPISISIALGIASKSGLLIKDARALEALLDVRSFVFDKTGTLTLGKPKVTSVHATATSEDELIKLAASAETGSEHILAVSIRDFAASKGIQVEQLSGFEAKPGLGLKAKINGQEVYVGGIRLLEVLNVPLTMGLAGAFAPEEVVFYVVRGTKLLGGFGLSDPLRDEARQTIVKLQALGVEPILVSGDRKEVCEAIASRLGISRVYAQMLPEEKVTVVESLRANGGVAMIGDGVNDAAALAAADASFAPSSGTGMALDVADITVMREDLGLIPLAFSLARATRKNINWNLFWAFIYNTISIPIAAGILYPLGILLDPMIASAAMAMSSITVVLNALRLRRFKA